MSEKLPDGALRLTEDEMHAFLAAEPESSRPMTQRERRAAQSLFGVERQVLELMVPYLYGKREFCSEETVAVRLGLTVDEVNARAALAWETVRQVQEAELVDGSSAD